MNEHSKLIKSLQRNKSDDCYIKILKNFHLTNSLKTIANRSWKMDASTRDVFRIEKQEDINQEAMYVNQFVLAYLANVLIVSGSNNHKSVNLGDFTRYELMCFCSSYFNNLSEPLISDKNFSNYFIRLNFEQFDYNICEAYCIARSVELYSNISDNLGLDLNTCFINNTQLTIDSYFNISYIIYLFAQILGPAFKMQQVVDTVINYFPNIHKSEVEQFLKINSTNIENLREIDKNRNLLCHRGSKYKYNFFKEFPIVEISNDNYIIPNKTYYIKQVFDIFWKFEKYIGNNFRVNYFDKIFDEYVGNILKNIYNTKNVKKITYKKNGGISEFFDWCVFDEQNKIVYAFECKGYQLSVSNIITGDIGKQYITKFIDKPVSQMYNRIDDLKSGKYQGINCLQNYEIIPIGIYYDIPFASGCIHEKEISRILDDDLTKYVTEKTKQINRIISTNNIEQLKNFNYYLMSIDDLELLQGAVQENQELLQLKELLLKMKNEDIETERFEKVVFDNIKSNTIKIPYLDNIFLKFDNGIMPQVEKQSKIGIQ